MDRQPILYLIQHSSSIRPKNEKTVKLERLTVFSLVEPILTANPPGKHIVFVFSKVGVGEGSRPLPDQSRFMKLPSPVEPLTPHVSSAQCEQILYDMPPSNECEIPIAFKKTFQKTKFY